MNHNRTRFVAFALASTSALADVKLEVVNVSEQRALVSFNSGLQSKRNSLARSWPKRTPHM